MRFHRRGKTPLRVVLELAGDFHEDIRGKVDQAFKPKSFREERTLGEGGAYMESSRLSSKVKWRHHRRCAGGP